MSILLSVRELNFEIESLKYSPISFLYNPLTKKSYFFSLSHLHKQPAHFFVCEREMKKRTASYITLISTKGLILTIQFFYLLE